MSPTAPPPIPIFAWKVGHRVYSASEPELGLGEIESLVEERVVQVRFDLASQRRRYAARGPHIRRVDLKVGDQAVLRDGRRVALTSVDASGDFLRFASHEVPDFGERDLHPRQVFSSSKENLLAGRWGKPKLYSLLADTHRVIPQGDKLKAALLASNRVSLLDHQLFVAWKATENLPVRMLLSDEVGLGKTIEAGLITTLLLGLGRAQRVVITCPDALQNQWLAEIFRRFNLYVSLYPEVENEQETASFLGAHRHVIVPWSRMPQFLAGFQTASSPFDLLILDEAHQLLSEELLQSEPLGLRVIEWILSTRNALFLTATPKFLGLETEFRLLNLLNDDEFPEYDAYLDKVEKLKLVDAALKELDHDAPSSSKLETPKLDKLLKGFDGAKDAKALPPIRLRSLIAEVWGYGDTVVRNRRAKLHFDIRRKLHRVALESEHAEPTKDFAAYQGLAAYPAKIVWLQQFLRERPNEKHLIIASSQLSAVQIHRELTEAGGFRAALFHEGMDLVSRDRAAEWFHQEDGGAQVLVCSEIGGEGRNFQHATGLVLLDLPIEPNLLEQRIGRLDRIGRVGPVDVYIPFEIGSPEQHLIDWYDEALEIFSEPWNGELDMNDLAAAELLDLVPRVLAREKGLDKRLDALVTTTRKRVADHRKKSGEALETLLDIQSFDPARSREIREMCEGFDPDDLIDYLDKAFDFFDIDFNSLDDEGTFSVSASSLSFAEDLSEFVKFGDRSLTTDRERALARENLSFVSIEHPIVRSLQQNILQKAEGYASLAVCESIPGSMVLQVLATLQVPPHKGWDLSAYFGRHSIELNLNDAGQEIRLGALDETKVHRPKIDVTAAFLASLAQRSSPLIERAESLLQTRAQDEVKRALERAHEALSQEVEKIRLKAFAGGEEEAREELVTRRMNEIETAIRQTEPRIEGLRLIINPRAR